MNVEPAHVSQLHALNGGFVEVSADVGEVAADLARIDPQLKVRFWPDRPKPFFAVVCCPDERTEYLVLTAQAYQGATGVWLGLDQRVVREIERIGADDYDFAGEVQARNETAEAGKAAARHHRLLIAEEAAVKLASDLRGRNCGHMSVQRALPA